MIKEEAEKLDEAFSFELKQEREFSQEAENSLSARNKEIRQWQERVKDLGNTNDRLVGMLTSKAIKAVCVGAVLLVALLLCAGRL
jgi:cell shape-determining protein MreC